MAHPQDIFKDPHVWVTQDRQHILITDLKDSHLANILRYLYRRAPEIQEHLIWEAYSFPEPRGDMAQLAYEQGLRDLEDEERDPERTLTEAIPQFRHLMEEAKKRNLKVLDELMVDWGGLPWT